MSRPLRSRSCFELQSYPHLDDLSKVTEISSLEEDFQTNIQLLASQGQHFQNPHLSLSSPPLTAITTSLSLSQFKEEFKQKEIFAWQTALQEVLVEKRRLVELLQRYRGVVKELRTILGEGNFLRAINGTLIRRRSRTEDSEQPIISTMDVSVEAIPYSDESGSNEDKNRKFSASSSILYAGVEPSKHINPRLAVPRPTSSLPPKTTAIINAMQGGWFYKYPRRQYQKLIVLPTLPLSQLSYRFFWLNPIKGLLCWADDESRERTLRQVKLTDFYTEERLLPRELDKEECDDNPESKGKSSTIIVLITDERKPLAIVPTNQSDLEVWISALQILVKAMKSTLFPFNFRVDVPLCS